MFDTLQFTDMGFSGVQPILDDPAGPAAVVVKIELGHSLPV